MQCPTCNNLNAATDVRCMRCQTTLIHEAAGHSEGFKKAANALDARMYSGIGAFFGFALTAVLLKFVLTEHWLSDRQIYLSAVVAGVVGSILGRLFLKARQNF
ncbi:MULTISPECIES: zinc finger Ran-binding domain-containing protein [unclassified Acidovorax]|uniref:zinc finger Ran-binding domain-containing protein n=2 Tax=Acidovorax TaxID=12916 RepID=UPI0012E2AD09|nr:MULTISPECIES: Ran-binding zinc finger domain-containing protein [unclassified Acidovorax]